MKIVSDSASSAWWSWPLMFSPDGHQVTRWFDVTWNLPNNTVSTISVFGNPAVWWVGFVTVIVLAIEGFHVEFALRNLWQRIKKVPERVSINAGGWDAAAIFIVVVFAFAWLPFVFIGRAAYIYHYYNAVPMLCLAIVKCIKSNVNRNEAEKPAIHVPNSFFPIRYIKGTISDAKKTPMMRQPNGDSPNAITPTA